MQSAPTEIQARPYARIASARAARGNASRNFVLARALFAHGLFGEILKLFDLAQLSAFARLVGVELPTLDRAAAQT